MIKVSGIAAAPHHLAASLGAETLRQGGNAFDAAVVISLAIGVTQPYHSGLGGGCNSTFLTSAGEAAHVNARGPAPKDLTRALFLNSDGSPNYDLVKSGGLAVTVPSLVAGLVSLHEGRGKLPWRDLCSAVIPLAADGFSADFRLASVYENEGTRNKVARHGAESVFAKPVQEGDWIKQPQMARTLERLARNPRDFYEGEVAKQLVKTVQDNGGVLALDDLRGYQAELTPLYELEYRGWRVLTPGLPTVGSLQTQLALKILNRLSLENVGLNSVQHQHLIAEVVRATYAERAKVDSAEAAALMIKDEVAARLAAQIDPHRATIDFTQDEDAGTSCTSHFCVADREGNVVSQTQTIRSHFGSGVVDAETGVVLNDSVGDFSLRPGEVTTQGISYRGNYNLLEPSADPASSQSPIIAIHKESGDIIAAGAAGGGRIVSATLHTLVNQIDFAMDARLAVALPRVHSHGPTTYVEAENATRSGLEALGHQVEVFAPAGIAQTIRRRGDVWEGGADGRGPGGVAEVVEQSDSKMTVRRYGYD